LDWTLFFSALVSSTLFPGGSEALVLYRIHEGDTPSSVLLTATSGNVLGSLITYGMGWFGSAALHHRFLRINEAHIERSRQWFDHYGKLSLLLAWLPIVGDPLCLVAGILKSSFWWFLILVSLGKLGRYALIINLIQPT